MHLKVNKKLNRTKGSRLLTLRNTVRIRLVSTGDAWGLFITTSLMEREAVIQRDGDQAGSMHRA